MKQERSRLFSCLDLFNSFSKNKITEAHIEHGFSWLRASDRTLESIEKLELGVRLVLHGFLVFFYQETYSETADVNEDLLSLFEHFKKTELPLDLLGKNLKEHLALLSILVVDNNFDVVDVEIDDKP
jgi:hypothetical protein